MSPARVLVVHPDREQVDLMMSMLQSMGHKLDEAENDRAVMRILERQPVDLLLLGADPENPDCLELLIYMKRKYPRVPILVFFTTPHQQRQREATRAGALDVFRFPMPANDLRAAVTQALMPMTLAPAPIVNAAGNAAGNAGGPANPSNVVDAFVYLNAGHAPITGQAYANGANQDSAGAGCANPLTPGRIEPNHAQVPGMNANAITANNYAHPDFSPNSAVLGYANASNGHGNGNGNGHGNAYPGAAPASSVTPAVRMPTPRRAEPYLNRVAIPMLGQDPAILHALELAGSMAMSRTPILITGEKGAGKTLLSRYIHSICGRTDEPAVELGMVGMREALMEREFLGSLGDPDYPDAPGKLARAHQGTLIIDEVAALPLTLQARMLSFLDHEVFEPLGNSGQLVRADVRIIFNSRYDLSVLVERGAFRQDVFFRVSVVTIRLPPLRHRLGDLEMLAEHFRHRACEMHRKRIMNFAPDAMEQLLRHNWPGNVAELANVVERCVLLSPGPRITSQHVLIEPPNRPQQRLHQGPGGNADANALSRNPNGSVNPSFAMDPHINANLQHAAIHSAAPSSMPSSAGHARNANGIRPLKEALEDPEKQIILTALECLNWNRQETARILDINRTTLYKKMKKYGLLVEDRTRDWIR